MLALLWAIAFWLFQQKGWFVLAQSSKDAYLGALLSLGGVFTGFMATLKALLFGLSDRIYKKLKSSGYEKDLLRYLAEALWGSLTVCGLALISFHLPLHPSLSAALGGVVIFSIACIARVSTIATALMSLRG